MLNSLFIFLGAGCGGVFRYWLSNLTHWYLDRAFPYGTLVVNVSGCFLMGFLFVLLVEKTDGAPLELRSLLLIGLLGGYTTFSAFSIETINLFENGAMLGGLANILLSVTLCLAMTWLGVIGARQL